MLGTTLCSSKLLVWRVSFSAVHFSAVHFSAVHFSAVHFSAVHFSTEHADGWASRGGQGSVIIGSGRSEKEFSDRKE